MQRTSNFLITCIIQNISSHLIILLLQFVPVETSHLLLEVFLFANGEAEAVSAPTSISCVCHSESCAGSHIKEGL